MSRKFLTPLDLATNEIQNATIQNLAAAPGSPKKGQVYFDTTSNHEYVYNGTSWEQASGASGSGTVTTVSVVSANGFTGSVANATTTPAITLTTSITGLLKGNGTAISAAVAGTDYLAPSAISTDGTFASPSNTTVPSTQAVQTYVQANVQGLSIKGSVRVATTGSESYTIASGSVTQITGTTIDGVTVSVGDRVLIKDAPSATGAGSANSSQPGNGIYSVTANTTNLTLARTSDMSGTNNPSGAYTFVEAGTTNVSAGYTVSTPNSSAAFTYGTGNIQWTQFSGAGEITAGTGLTKSGNTLSVAASYAGGTSIATVGTITTGTWTGTSIAVTNGGTGATTAAAARTNLGATAKFTGTIGDGSTTAIAVTHGLGSQFVTAQVFDASTNAKVECDITLTSSTQTTFTFAVAPATNAYRVVIVG